MLRLSLWLSVVILAVASWLYAALFSGSVALGLAAIIVLFGALSGMCAALST
jgi:hypothetical protein